MSAALRPTISPATEALLMREGRPRRFKPGEVVFHQGDPCDSLFLLRCGRVAVHAVTPDGDDITVGLIAAPDAFGEVGLVRGDQRHTATVVAVDEVHVLCVPAERFHRLRRDHPALTDWLLVTLALRLERTTVLLSESLFLDAEHRVARRLLDCVHSLGTGVRDPLPITQKDLAAMAGVARPTANRVLRRLEEQGTVRLGRRHIEVLDPVALAGAAG